MPLEWAAECSIDILASDHAPHLPEEKGKGHLGGTGGRSRRRDHAAADALAVKRNLIRLERLVDALAAGPARIFGLSSKGSIEIGKDADLVIVDPKAISRINADRLHSRADWTPYEGKEAIFPEMTMVRGVVVYDGDLRSGQASDASRECKRLYENSALFRAMNPILQVPVIWNVSSAGLPLRLPGCRAKPARQQRRSWRCDERIRRDQEPRNCRHRPLRDR